MSNGVIRKDITPLRIDTSDKNNLFTINSNGWLGLGTSTPTDQLHITQNTDFVTGMVIQNARTNLVDQEEANAIYFQAGAGNPIAKISSFTEGTTVVQGGLQLFGYDAGYNSGLTLFRDGDITFNGAQVSTPVGTESLPGVSFVGDPNTGMWRPTADQVAFSTAGTQRVLIDENGNVVIPELVANSYVDDASAGTGGVPVGGLYRCAVGHSVGATNAITVRLA